MTTPRLTTMINRGVDKLIRLSQEDGRGCFNFTGYRNRLGYGRFRYLGEKWLAHRLSYFLFVGEIPDDKRVLHRCDNPACVNPWHLYLGTDADNARDMASRGRQWSQRAKAQGINFSTTRRRNLDKYRRTADEQ